MHTTITRDLELRPLPTDVQKFVWCVVTVESDASRGKSGPMRQRVTSRIYDMEPVTTRCSSILCSRAALDM